MYLVLSFAVILSVLVVSNAQFPQYSPQFSEGQLSQSYNPHSPYSEGYQLRAHPPPPFNPFDNMYSPNGEKLTCITFSHATLQDVYRVTFCSYNLQDIYKVVSNAQFPQYPPQYPEGQLSQSYNPYSPYRGGYQLRPHPPPRFNPFDNVYSPSGEKLTCRMVCGSYDDNDEVDDDVTTTPEKKDSNENKIGKKE